MAAALGLGALLTVLIMAVGGFDDDVVGPAVAIGFVVTIVGGIVAVAATRKT
jgi:hypothetical protein